LNYPPYSEKQDSTATWGGIKFRHPHLKISKWMLPEKSDMQNFQHFCVVLLQINTNQPNQAILRF